MTAEATVQNSLEMSKSSKKFIDAIIDSIKNVELEKWEHFLSQENFLKLLPCNPVTKTTYKGNNSLLLLMMQIKNDWRSNKYLTYNQIKSLGGSNKGATGIPITHFFILAIALKKEKGLKPTLRHDEYEKLSEEDKKKYRLQFSEKISYVFNLDTVTDLPESITNFEIINTTFDEFSENEIAEKHLRLVIESNKIDFEEVMSERAYYSPSSDHIRLPFKKLFKSAPQYYSTSFHEIIHWTGHKSRLNRFEVGSYFGNEKYAFEELVAEIGSMLILRDLEIFNSLLNSLSYLKSWLNHCEKTQETDTLVYNAFYQSKKAINLINY